MDAVTQRQTRGNEEFVGKAKPCATNFRYTLISYQPVTRSKWVAGSIRSKDLRTSPRKPSTPIATHSDIPTPVGNWQRKLLSRISVTYRFASISLQVIRRETNSKRLALSFERQGPCRPERERSRSSSAFPNGTPTARRHPDMRTYCTRSFRLFTMPHCWPVIPRTPASWSDAGIATENLPRRVSSLRHKRLLKEFLCVSRRVSADLQLSQ